MATAEAQAANLCTRCRRVAAQPSLDRCEPCAEAVGAAVTGHLKGVAGVHRLPTDKLQVYLMRDFLDAEECQRLMALIDADKQPSGILSSNPDPTFRTSESCNLKRDNPFVAGIESKINVVTGIDPIYGETVQGQRYDVTQQFKAHHDFFYKDQPYWPAEERNGGQRTWTAMIFLNEPEGGGQTYFPKIGARITPRAGNLLIWNNLDAQGAPNPFSLHEAMPVTAGLKYVVTKWYRERPWAIEVPAAPAGATAPRRMKVIVQRGQRRKLR